MSDPTSYQRALQKLNCRRAAPATSLADMRGSDDMEPWLRLLGYDLKHLESLNIIHVAGTNGKGSTCTAIARLLQAHTELRPETALRIGLYTSPHVLHVRERICIEGQPISEELFARRFWEIDGKLPDSPTSELDSPRYLQTLCLLSFHVFITAGVNVAVYETHMGGEYDATNIIPSPVVTAITSIADDHLEWLGPERSNIAWHKAGIFKPGAIALTVPQDPAVLAVLERRANEKHVTLTVIGGSFRESTHGLTPVARSMNYTLAAAVHRTWVSIRASESEFIDTPTLEGVLADVNLPGRFQVIHEAGLTWHLDGGHNIDGVEQSTLWFCDLVYAPDHRHELSALIFAHNSRRDSKAVLSRI